MNPPLRIFLVSGAPRDVARIEKMLVKKNGTAFQVVSSPNIPGFISQVSGEVPDAILVDPGVPGPSCLDTLQQVLQHAKTSPVILLAEQGDGKTALEAVREGASDCLVKGSFRGADLAHSIRVAIEREKVRDIARLKTLEEEIRKNEARVQSLIEITRFKAADSQELMEFALKQALRLTSSSAGFIFRYEEKTRNFTLAASTEGLGPGCAIGSPKPSSHLSQTGFWSEAVRQRKAVIDNDFLRPNPLKKGFPKGHIRLARFLSAPIFSGNEIVAVVGIANKDSDYSDGDVRQLTLLMAAIWGYLVRSLVQEAMKKSEERYRELVENLEDIIFSLDSEGKFSFISPVVRKLLGFTVQEVIGAEFESFIFPDDLESVRKVFHQRRDEQSSVTEFRIWTKTGVFKWVRTAIRVVKSQGKPCGFNGVLTDISRHKALEAGLFQISQDWENTFDSITDIVTVQDKDFNIILANRKARETFPALQDPTRLVKCYEVFHGTQKPPEWCPSYQALKSNSPTTLEIFEPSLQKFLEIQSIPRSDASRGIPGILQIVEDITERKKAEGALKRRAEIEHVIATISSRFVWTSDIQEALLASLGELGTLAEASASFLFRFEGRGRVAENCFEWRAPGAPSKISMFRAMASNLPLNWVRRLNQKENIRVPDVSLMTPEDSEEKATLEDLGIRSILLLPLTVGGRTAGFVGFIGTGRLGEWIETEQVLLRTIIEIIGNAIEREEATQALQRSESQLRQAQKMEAIGQMAGGIAHDFNNLLGIILGNAELLDVGASGDPERAEQVKAIIAAIDKGSDLTRKMLAFSRRQVLNPSHLDLNLRIPETMKMLRRIIPENIEIHFIPGFRLGTIFADPVQVDQILMNFAINSRDAMPTGGKITIETENVLIDEEYTRTHPDSRVGRFALLSFSDTGSGIKREDLPKVFEPFFTTKGLEKGTGLGLAVVYGIVHQHSGMITAYSEPGRGSTFKVYLPIAEQKASEVHLSHAEKVNGGAETILLAEDDEGLRRLGKRLLELGGYKVLTASDGEEALLVLRENSRLIHLALLDVIMPRKGGREVYEEIRRSYPDIRVLFTSGYPSSAIPTEFVIEEGLQLIMKPYTRDSLLRKVREILG